MTQTMFEPTLQVDNKAADVVARDGCLLQIHPVQIDTGRIELTDSVLIGRENGCDVTITDASISRRHATIDCKDGQFIVTDLNSTNGTWVNESSVLSGTLQPGDRIRFGSVVFKFLPLSDIESQHHDAVYQMMTRDSLTGVWNKRYFLEVLERDLRRDARYSRPTSLVIFDIDHFKNINDTYGHLAGDDVLREMGSRVSDVLRNGEVFARYGGEEFVVIVGECDSAMVGELAERCRAIVEATPFQTSEGPINVTISLGVADTTSSGQPMSSTELISKADLKLYEAKRGGRNRVCG